MTRQRVREIDLRSRIERLAAGHGDFSTVRAGLDRELRAALEYDVGALSTLDPATMCWTSCFVSGIDLDPGFEKVVYDHEFGAFELNSYAALARADRPVGRLSAITDGQLSQVGRFADLLQPLDATDEMRAVLRSHGACWGTLTLYRRRPKSAFSADDEDILAAVASSIADLFRLTMLRAAVGANSGAQLGPGLLTVTTRGDICERTAGADAWLDEIDDRDRTPSVIASLAIAASKGNGLARAALPSRNGTWITLHASGLRNSSSDSGVDRVAIIIEAARPIQLNDLVADAYGLTPREREVTVLITTGRANKEIAQCLGLSRYTVEDHIKAVFRKTAVSNRGSLVALLQNEHYQTRADAGNHPGPYGWYLDDSIRIA
jgi:DNA-binding CsgD family transcriptional regulator